MLIFFGSWSDNGNIDSNNMFDKLGYELVEQVMTFQPALLWRSCTTTHSLSCLVLLCQEKEGGVCFEVVLSEAREECSRVPGAQRQSPANRACYAPPALLPYFTARRNPDWVEGWHCYSTLRGLKLLERVCTWECFCLYKHAWWCIDKHLIHICLTKSLR